MNYAYIRINSDVEVDYDEQYVELSLCCNIDKIFVDESSSSDLNRSIVSKFLVEAMGSDRPTLFIYSKKILSDNRDIRQHYERMLFISGVRIVYVKDNVRHRCGDYFGIILESPELARAVMAKNLLDGRIDRARDGKIASGIPPFGYRSVDTGNGKIYSICLDEAHIVVRANKLYLQEGSIGKAISVLKLETGTIFSRQKFHDLLTDSIYVGTLSYRGVQVSKPELRIIDDEIRNKVLEMLSTNRRKKGRTKDCKYNK